MDNETSDILNNDTSLKTEKFSDNSSLQSRPKLRKFKRPKIGQMPGAPVAPEKEAGVEEVNFVEAPLENSESVDISNVNSDQQESHNDLITSAEANEIAQAQSFENSYPLDDMPSELDYESDDYFDDNDNLDGYVKKNVLVVAGIVCLFLGMFVGKALFSSKKIEQHGLEGVVINQDVPSGRPRCGLTDKSQACVFYLMNWYKQELNGRDFYKLAAQLTGREEYMIETDNLRYATIKIKPGHFAQLNIPALK